MSESYFVYRVFPSFHISTFARFLAAVTRSLVVEMVIALAPPTGVRVLSEMRTGSATILALREQLQKADLLHHDVAKELKISHDQEFEDTPSAAKDESIDIPSIDLSLVETDRAELVRKLGDAARQWGICRVINHGIPIHLMKEVEINGLNFFSQSVEQKSNLPHRKDESYYTGNNTEEKLHSLHWAESFLMKLSSWRTLDLDVIKKDTIDWPSADDEFRTGLLSYLMGLKSASENILQLAAESLGLKSNFYSKPILESGLRGRWNYYPACPLPADVLGAHSHTDPNVMTMLHQDKVGGLQVEKDGSWYNVKPVEGALIMNIGDMFQIWSNGIFKSVLHRVLANKDVPRISIAWLLYSQRDKSLSPPNELIDENHPRLYRDVTGKEYLHQVIEARTAGVDPKVFDGHNHIETLKI